MKTNSTSRKGTTVIIGASPDPSRYAYMAASLLLKYEYEFEPVGIKKGTIFGKEIQDIKKFPNFPEVDTITLYIRPELQMQWADYVLSLKPKRIIFNPGTENIELEKQANDLGIETIEACTLVMLNTNQY
jgi:uncharacterized protein